MIHHLLEAVRTYIAHALSSPFGSGGLMLMLFGGAAAALRSLPGRIMDRLKSRITTIITITERDPLFDWVCLWMARHDYVKRCRLLSAATRFRKQESSPYSSGTVSTPVLLSPADGTHALRYHDKWLMVARNKESSGGAGVAAAASTNFGQETLTLTFGTTDRSIVSAFFDEVRELANPPHEPRVRVWTNRYADWSSGRELPARDPESVILPHGVYERLEVDIQTFTDSEEFYRRVGIPHRRGYLFEGLPGTGKTSLIRALASRFECDLYVLNLAEDNLTDSNLTSLMASIYGKAIVAIEDIDSYFDGRKAVSETLKLSFSGLLNALDGAAAAEGRILIMTTNHRDRLDPALTRPGRVDYEVKFGEACEGQVDRMFTRFYPDGTGADRDRFFAELWAKYPDRCLTTAQVQAELYAQKMSMTSSFEASPKPQPAMRFVARSIGMLAG